SYRRRDGRRANAARIEHLQRKRERVDAFQKERPLLGQERLDVGQVQDHLVGFYLGEVGVEGGVQRDVVGEVPLEVEARRTDQLEPASCHDVFDRVLPARGADAERNQLQGAAALEPTHIVQPAEIGDGR